MELLISLLSAKNWMQKVVYISTDYVFDGQGTEPWQPDCKDYKPLNVYGQTKLDGELAVSSTLENILSCVSHGYSVRTEKSFIKPC